jgi:hypothetical protein
MSRRFSVLAVEFAHHLPYTIISSLIAMAAVWLFGASQMHGRGFAAWAAQLEWSFHVLHPMHVCLSAIATTSVFWHYERRLAKALTVGFLGAVIPCGMSDYIFPFVGGRMLGQAMELHVCLLDHPMLIFPFLLVGIVCGLLFEERMAGGSVFSHGAHVFVSSLASLLYLVSFGFTGWLADARMVFPVFLVVVIAVWIPCCISDIVVPITSLHEYPHGGPQAVPRASV